MSFKECQKKKWKKENRSELMKMEEREMLIITKQKFFTLKYWNKNVSEPPEVDFCELYFLPARMFCQNFDVINVLLIILWLNRFYSTIWWV